MTHPEDQPPSGASPQRFDALVAALIDSAMRSPGQLSVERRAAFAGGQVEGVAGDVAEKVRRRAYTVTDEDLATLRREGMDEDAIFELVIACAVGEAGSLLQTGLEALRDSA